MCVLFGRRGGRLDGERPSCTSFGRIGRMVMPPISCRLLGVSRMRVLGGMPVPCLEAPLIACSMVMRIPRLHCFCLHYSCSGMSHNLNSPLFHVQCTGVLCFYLAIKSIIFPSHCQFPASFLNPPSFPSFQLCISTTFMYLRLHTQSERISHVQTYYPRSRASM